MTPLCELAVKHKTDKFWPHGYTPVYFERFAGKTASTHALLEVGIGKRGGSMRMWQEFFPVARIVGIDRVTEYHINEGRIRSYHADQDRPKELIAVAREAAQGLFDIIIDDGAHDVAHQVSTLDALLPFLDPAGTYFVEDIKDKIGPIIDAVPVGYSAEIFEGKKLLPSGRGERMLIVQRRKAP